MKQGISATFQCKVCGLDTETIRLVSRGSSSAITFDSGSTTMDLSSEQYEKVKHALEAADARALHAAHPRWIPVYCPQCQACYCRSHWTIDQLPDPDSDSYSMHYDTYGTCPSGHKRLMAKDSLSWPMNE